MREFADRAIAHATATLARLQVRCWFILNHTSIATHQDDTHFRHMLTGHLHLYLYTDGPSASVYLPLYVFPGMTQRVA